MSALDRSTTSKLSSVKTEILVGWIFALLTVIAWVGLFVVFFVFFFVVLGLLGTSGGLVIVGLVYGLIFLIMMIPSLLVFRRLNQMRGAANRGNIIDLKELNSIGWAIVALIFTGVIPGIMLLVAHGPIEELGWHETGGGAPSDNLDRLAKLKGLLDSGVISQDEYEAQKNSLLHPGATKAAGFEDELKKLKALRDSGALTAAEYEDLKRKVLGRV